MVAFVGILWYFSGMKTAQEYINYNKSSSLTSAGWYDAKDFKEDMTAIDSKLAELVCEYVGGKFGIEFHKVLFFTVGVEYIDELCRYRIIAEMIRDIIKEYGIEYTYELFLSIKL